MENLFLEIGIVIIAATLLGAIARILKQPLILAYILAGILIGPIGFKLISSQETIGVLSTLGIAFLLFLIGLELDFKKIKEIGVDSFFIGIIEVILVTILGFLGGLALGFSSFESLLIGFALSFSSTVVVTKLLTEKHDLNTLYGKLTLGILLAQDFIAVIVLILISSFKINGVWGLFSELPSVLIKGIGIFVLALLFSKYIFPITFKFIAKSGELLFLTSIAWCFFLVGLSQLVGFSPILGAFLAGMSLAALPYNIEIIGQIKSLRDFFLTIFFVTLGMQLIFPSLSSLLLPLFIFSIITLILKPFIILVLISLFGFEKRVSFLSSLTLAQVSEFSLIILSVAFSFKFIDQNLISLITLVAILSITLSVYATSLNGKFYKILQPILKLLERKKIKKEEEIRRKFEDHVVIFGYHRLGRDLYKVLREMEKDVLIIDFNPKIISELSFKNIPCLYGDATDQEILKRANIKRAHMVISTIPDREDNLFLLKEIKRINKDVPVIVTGEEIEDALELYKNGASYVILPYFLSGRYLKGLIERFEKKKRSLSRTKKAHLKQLILKKEEIGG